MLEEFIIVSSALLLRLLLYLIRFGQRPGWLDVAQAVSRCLSAIHFDRHGEPILGLISRSRTEVARYIGGLATLVYLRLGRKALIELNSGTSRLSRSALIFGDH